MSQGLGISGSIAKKFLHTEITPLLALVGFLLGVFAVMVTPREEEPQINVTFANVFIPFPGASAQEVEQLVSTPAEQVLSEISGVEHVYSVSRPGMSTLTIQFLVGEDRTQAIVRLYNKVFSNQDWLPTNLGVGKPIIKPKGIDDVPIVSLTLWSEDENSNHDLQQIAHSIESTISRVPGTRNVSTIGGSEKVVHILLDPSRLAGYDIDLAELSQTISSANSSQSAGSVTQNNQEIIVQAGSFLGSVNEIRNLIIDYSNGTPIFLSDVASVKLGADQAEQFVWFGKGSAYSENMMVNKNTVKGIFPAVTIAISKKPGSNAFDVANQIISRVDNLKGIYIPDGVQVSVTRNYGATANDKAITLITKLFFATGVVVLLVFFALGLREAFIVGIAIGVTLALTLFASWVWGFTLNRVSLFALIFSIGILVDDAIVVVENIHRHMKMGKKSLAEAIPIAVDEVGGPTILATFAVIAALLPMAFVSGLMGPYMSPIPINASMGMIISLGVAFIITPWLTLKVLKNVKHKSVKEKTTDSNTKTFAMFNSILAPLLKGNQGKGKRWALFGIIIVLILGSVGLAGAKLVVLKMLPFDNKSEIQIILDMPEGSSLEQTNRVLTELGDYIADVPEVTQYQIYAGTAAPINFNGLVRQYYLRNAANAGDIMINLQHKKLRSRNSHDIASSLRKPLQNIGKNFNANVKIVEVPPGPPVQSPIVAEVYGLDYNGQIEVAKLIRANLENTADIVDVDDSVEAPAEKWILKVDRQKAAKLGVNQKSITHAISAVLRGYDVSQFRTENVKYSVPIRLAFSNADKADIDSLLSLKVRANSGDLISLSNVVEVIKTQREFSIFHKDLLPVVFITGDLAGNLDSPLYGMFDVFSQLQTKNLSPLMDEPIEQYLINQPENPYQYSVKWDGEWQVTYETFRDMGLAYSVGLLMIYLLVVAQFRSYLTPLVIMAPIPLTIIGVMPGHAILGAQFTATSMIGMIALAGIIVRNSILLVDFIQQELASGVDFQKAVINAAAVRAKPIVLTALAAILGALFILNDPIFNGLAIALIFGILISTILTLLVIPVMYYAFYYKKIDTA